MKKILIVSLFLFLYLPFQFFSEEITEITLGTVDCFKVDDDGVYERVCRLRYDGNYYLQINSSYETSWIDLSETQLETLRTVMGKYQEWKKIAKENKTNVTKEIPNSTIISDVAWKYRKDFYKDFYQGSRKIQLTFTISVINDGNEPALSLRSTRVTSKTNRYMDYETGDIFFIGEKAEEFQNMISKENINAAIKANRDEKNKTDKLFN